MRLGYAVAISMFLLGVIPSTAQMNSATKVGAAVENIRLEDGSKVAFVRIINNSHKDITAFNLSIDVTFKNGKTSHFEHMTDFLPGIISGGREALHSGNSYEVRIDVAPDTELLSANAKLDVVAYADLSADVDKNQDALTRLVAIRKSEALTQERSAEIINAAAADTVSPDPVGLAIRQLQQIAEQIKGQKSSELSETKLGVIIADLENRSAQAAFERKRTGIEVWEQHNTEVAFLRGYASKKNTDAVTVEAHSHLRRAN
jgi:hypothetical protein